MKHLYPAPPRRRRASLGPMTAAAALTLAATALAAGPKAGTYTGHLSAPRTAYVLHLTLTGTRLSPVTITSTPFYCSGGGPPTPVRFSPGTVIRSGSFTLHGVFRILVGPLKGKVGARLTLSGRFTSHGTVNGRLRTAYPNPGSCSGRSAFSAKR